MNIFDMPVLAPGPFPTNEVENRCLGALKIREKLRCQEGGRSDRNG